MFLICFSVSGVTPNVMSGSLYYYSITDTMTSVGDPTLRYTCNWNHGDFHVDDTLLLRDNYYTVSHIDISANESRKSRWNLFLICPN